MQAEDSIFVDARCFQSPQLQFRGVGRYTGSLLKHLPEELRAGRKIVAVCDRQLPDLPDELLPLFDEVTHAIPSYQAGGIIFNPSPMTAAPGWCTRLLGDPAFLTVAVVHDFIPHDFGGFLRSRADADRYSDCLALLRDYNYFFCNSQGTARRLAELCEVGEQRIYVTGIAARAGFFSRGEAPESPSGGPFVLTVGGADPRKNAKCVVAAAKSVRLPDGAPLGVAMVGDFSAETRGALRQELIQQGIGVETLIFLSDISDARLAGLCRNALAVVVPSFCEGFSMPVVEGIFAGGIVLASDIEAHRELIATSETLFDPYSPAALAAILQTLVNNPEARGPLAARQALQVAHLRDEAEIARKAWGWFFHHKASTSVSSRPKVRTIGSRPRFAFLTPFPPELTGVADFSEVALRLIGRKVDIDLFTDAPLQHRQFSHLRKVSSLTKAKASDLRPYDQVFFVIGNSHFHSKIVDLAQQVGGPCILHDARMLDYFNWRQGDRLAEFASSELGRPVDLDQAQRWLQQPLTSPTPFLKSVIDMARPPIVHSKVLQEEIAKHYGVEALYLPQFPVIGFDNVELGAERRRAVRKKLGVQDQCLNIGTFGQLTTNKGIIECVFAIKELHDWGVRAKLWLIGGGAPPLLERLHGMIERLQLQDWVVIKDHVGAVEYSEFLQAVDIGLQLRKIPFGQVSGALVDCIVAGLPSVANESLARAIQSPDFVWGVPDVLSPVLIGEKILEIWESGLTDGRHLEARALWLEAHSVEKYARDFLAYFAPEVLGTVDARGVA